MEMLSNLTLAVFSILGFVLIIIALVLPYLIYQVRLEIRAVRKELAELKGDAAEEQQKPERTRWKVNRFKKI